MIPPLTGTRWSRDYDRLYESREDPAIIVAALGRLMKAGPFSSWASARAGSRIGALRAGWHVVGVEAPMRVT